MYAEYARWRVGEWAVGRRKGGPATDSTRSNREEGTTPKGYIRLSGRAGALASPTGSRRGEFVHHRLVRFAPPFPKWGSEPQTRAKGLTRAALEVVVALRGGIRGAIEKSKGTIFSFGIGG